MPNLVVYVPARLARSLEAIGVSEDLQRRACREVLVGLADGELGAGEPEAAGVSARGVRRGAGVPSEAGGRVASSPSERQAASPAPSSREVRPDFKGGSK